MILKRRGMYYYMTSLMMGIDPTLTRYRTGLWAAFFAGVFACAPFDGFAADTLISPDDPGINYFGRFDFSNPKTPRFNWCGSTIECMVSGSTTVGMEITDGAGYYDVEVDGAVQSAPVYANSWSSKKYALATGLSSGSHVIRIIHRNEPYWAIATLSGIYLSSGATLLPWAKPPRTMEFCGDSWTAGYFVEACADQQLNTNANKSWARLTSKAFKAQDVILAESGICLVQKSGGRTCFPKKYPGTFDTTGGIPTPLWNFSSWIPDIVSIFLGINDKNSGVSDNDFITAVHSFVNTIRGNYPNASILFIALTGDMDQAAKTAVAAETTTLGHKGVYYLECTITATGCQYHPTVAEDKKIADSVIATIKRITGWDTTQSSATLEAKCGAYPTAHLNVGRIDRGALLISAYRGAAGGPILIVNAHGQVVKQLQLDASHQCRWNTAETSEGMYFIGGLETGWKRVSVP